MSLTMTTSTIRFMWKYQLIILTYRITEYRIDPEINIVET